MKVYDETGKEMIHPNEVRDMVNDSAHGMIQYMNYKMDYEEAKLKQQIKS